VIGTRRTKPLTMLPLAVTMGDPAGIGPDIIVAAWHQRTAQHLPPFVVYGDPAVLASRAHALGIQVAVTPIQCPSQESRPAAAALPVVDTGSAGPVTPGAGSTHGAAATLAAIDRAVADVLADKAAGLVTAPITKSVLYEAGFRHPGHTEYLAHRANAANPGHHFHPVMMLACGQLKVVPATIHIPLRDVPAALTQDLLTRTIMITDQALKRDFRIPMPRIAVTGLNPHAGEQGTLGTEDRDIIAPVIAALQAQGLHVTGPHSADTLFHAAARRRYDAALAMYHDQALIPIKTLAFDEGVNVTLGLPFVRTSPDHGTAYDIAASGRADPQSFIAALKLAALMAQNRTSPAV